jgi:microcystin-dependent protein
MSSIFNPILWKKSEIADIKNETLEQLDDRYINVGENVLDQNINNLNLVNLNISSSGRIYFNGDNTTQTTAYDPNFITNQINLFKSSTNTFTGENNFTNLNIIDALLNSNKTQISQNGNLIKIKNLINDGQIHFSTKTSSSVANIIIDAFGNIIGVNDVNSSKVKTNQIILNNSIYLTQSGVNLVFQNYNNFCEFHFKGSSGWTLAFNPSTGQLGGMNNIVSHISETKYIKFRDPTSFQLTGSQIYQSGRDIIIDNGNLPGNFKLKHKTAEGIEKVLLINEFMNMTGINDINMNGQLKITNNITHKFENNNYVIDNKNNGSGIQINNYESSGTLRQLTIDQFSNVNGINDLRCNKLYISNSLINFNNYNTTVTNTQLINYSNNPQHHQSVIANSGGIIFMPSINSSYNPMAQQNDNIIYPISVLSEPILSLTSLSGTKNGIRIKENETEAYNLKILDGGLKFQDNTVQTTAMTDTYLTNLIQSVVNQMTIIPQIPIGAIIPYGANYADATTLSYPPPAGYLWCIGEMVSIDLYQNLFNVIGHNFLQGKSVLSGFFYLPELQGSYLKGCGESTLFSQQKRMDYVGNYQEGNVGGHAHTYKDRGSGSYSIASQNPSPGTSTTIANDTDGMYWTDGKAYNSVTHIESDEENRPNSIGVNYIIKY